MCLLGKPEGMGHVCEAVSHFNHALDLKVYSSSNVDVARAMSDGLNKLQTWGRDPEQESGEVKAFKTMILDGLSSKDKDDLLRSAQFRDLVVLDPKIMNHDTLRHKGYTPDVAIDSKLAKEAVEVHRKLENAYRDLEHGDWDEVRERVVKHVANLLYIVRCNIAHGEKTPYGPDLKKKERDEQVCIFVVPLQQLLFDMLLCQPSKKLISYGTLAPGEPNHSLVSDLKGEWEDCVIQGDLSQNKDLPQFTWNLAGSEHNASLFTSEDLPANWCRIDKFEGAKYKRRLVPTTTRAGNSVIAYAYVAN